MTEGFVNLNIFIHIQYPIEYVYICNIYVIQFPTLNKISCYAT